MLILKTPTLKMILGKAMKAVSNQKLLPITGLLGIETKGGYLYMYSYDGNNSLTTKVKVEYDKEHYVAIDANTFNALVQKVTAEEITLKFEESYLNVVAGGGNYKFDVAMEENVVVKFPSYPQNITQPTETQVVKTEDLELALILNQSAVAQTSEMVAITGAYFGEKIITTNGYMACITNLKVFKEPVLVKYSTLTLLNTLVGSTVTTAVVDGKLIMFDDSTFVVGELLPYVKEYPVETMMNFAKLPFKSEIKLAKKDLLSALDRLNIFISDFDKNILEVVVNTTSFDLRSLSSSAHEELGFAVEAITPTNFKIEYDYFKSQVSSTKDEILTIKFGNPSAIAIVEKNATHIIALVETNNGKN